MSKVKKMARNTRNTRSANQRETHSQPPERSPNRRGNQRRNATTIDAVNSNRITNQSRVTLESDNSGDDIEYVQDTIIRSVSLLFERLNLA